MLKKVIASNLPNPVKAIVKDVIAAIKRISVREPEFKKLSSLATKDVKFWEENGYLVLPKFFQLERLNKINILIDEVWQKRRANPNNPLVIDVFIGTDKGKRIFFKDAPDEAKKLPYKLNDLFLEFEEINELILDLELCKILNDLLEGEPMVCNSLNFERGSQQELHFDTFYMPPRVSNKMVATWIALEDCSLDAGPLLYYPGSHKIKPYYFSNGKLNAIQEELPLSDLHIQKELEHHNLKPEKFAAQAGDVFIWHSQLLHGGSEINDMNLTRKSVVTHYFRINEHPRDYITIGDYRHYQKRNHLIVPSQ